MHLLPLGPESTATTLERIYGKSCITITFQVTEDCCMACTYCYQHNKSKNQLAREYRIVITLYLKIIKLKSKELTMEGVILKEGLYEQKYNDIARKQ